MSQLPQQPQLCLIVAMAQNRVIGINNTLPWHISADLKHFKALTMGNAMLMGRKTFESIGKPLPGRTSVIVSRDQSYHIAGCKTAHSVEDALALCQEQEKIFVIGGAEIYQLALPYVSYMYITEIQKEVIGDAYFPELNPTEWREIKRQKQVQTTPEPLSYHFVEYQRIKNN